MERFLKAIFCGSLLTVSLAFTRNSQAQELMTPNFAFEHTSFIGCMETLSDSAMVWEELRYYGEAAPSRLVVEQCHSLTVSSYFFYEDSGADDAKRWTATWVSWLEQMRRSGVEEVAEILDAWQAEAQPYIFNYSLEMGGGFSLYAEPGRFSIEFYSAL